MISRGALVVGGRALDLDAHRVAHEAAGDALDARRHRRREQDRLAAVGRGREDRLDVLGEAHVEHLVGLVEHDEADGVEGERAPVDVVDRPARRGDDDVHAVAQGAELAEDRLPAVDRHDLGADAAPVAVARLGHLHGQLAGRHQHEGDRVTGRVVDELQRRQREGGRLAGAGGGLPEHVAAGEHLGDGVALDRRRLLVPERGDRLEQARLQTEVGEDRHGVAAVGLEPAGLDLDGLAPLQHAPDVQLGGAPLDGVGERVLDVGPVDEAVRRHLLERVRLGQELEHRRVAPGDDRGEAVEQPQELLAALDDALVVERHVPAGVLVADLGQARLEVLEVAPHVAVVRPEAGQVDVGQEEHVAADAEAAVATGVAGQVHGLDGRAAAEVEDVTVGEAVGVGTGREAELLDDGRRERVVDRHAVDVHQALQALHAREVLDVDVDPGIGERAVAGDVVLVAVAVDDGVDGDRRAALDDRHRRVDEQRLGRAAHEQRVPGRVGAVAGSGQHADGVRQLPSIVAPVRGHRSNVPFTRPDRGTSANCVRLSLA